MITDVLKKPKKSLIYEVDKDISPVLRKPKKNLISEVEI